MTAQDPSFEPARAAAPRLCIERLTLTDFRNYRYAQIEPHAGVVVLLGANGAGKTNILEALSLLTPGPGLRNASLSDFPRVGGSAGWSVAARVRSGPDAIAIGTGQAGATVGEAAKAGRTVRVDGVTQSGTSQLANHIEMLWLIPAMDGIFTGPAAERRRFLDRLILCFDASMRTRATAFERAMRQRNRLLADGERAPSQFMGLERQMAEMGVAVAAARVAALAQLAASIDAKAERDQAHPFPTADLAIEGTLESALGTTAAIDVEDAYAQRLSQGRERDRAAGRTLEGPHRSDLQVQHREKSMAAERCSSGEQKALLIGLILAHAELLSTRDGGRPPILLFDEVAAHLDAQRRDALFAKVQSLGGQAFMTGTELEAFSGLGPERQVFKVDDGQVTLLHRP